MLPQCRWHSAPSHQHCLSAMISRCISGAPHTLCPSLLCSWGITPVLRLCLHSFLWTLLSSANTVPKSYSHPLRHQATILPQFENGWKILTFPNDEAVSELVRVKAAFTSGGLYVPRHRAFVKEAKIPQKLAVLLS